MSDTSEAVRRKLRALLAKAGDGSGATEAEAANALAFARRLMLRHQLTERDLGDDARSADELAADEEYGRGAAFSSGTHAAAWENALSLAVAALVGTVGVYRRKGELRRSASGAVQPDAKGRPAKAVAFTFYGPEADVRDACELFDEWRVLIAACARTRWGGALRGPGRSYAEGFASALLERMREAQRGERRMIEANASAPVARRSDAALVATGEAADAECSALVVRAGLDLMKAKRRRADGWLRQQGVRLTRSSSGGGGAHHGEAHGQGRRDGSAAGFSRQRQRRLS